MDRRDFFRSIGFGSAASWLVAKYGPPAPRPGTLWRITEVTGTRTVRCTPAELGTLIQAWWCTTPAERRSRFSESLILE